MNFDAMTALHYDFDPLERTYVFDASELALIESRRTQYFALAKLAPLDGGDWIPCLVAYKDSHIPDPDYPNNIRLRALRNGIEVPLERQKVSDGRFYVKGHWANRAKAAFDAGEFGGEEVTFEELLAMLPQDEEEE